MVDTTAPDDCFIGYLITGLLSGKDKKSTMEQASKASAICIGRPGAAPSIPTATKII